MSDTNKYQNSNLEIIVNKRLKYSYISIDKNKNILVKTPYQSREFIDKFLDEKQKWIQKQFSKIDALKFIAETELYSQEFIQARVEYYSKLMNLEFTKLKFRKMKSRWGSCNSRREITLNTHLCRVDKELIDYVIVHELAHIKHMNHSKVFHALVEKYLLNSKLLRKKLKNIRLV